MTPEQFTKHVGAASFEEAVAVTLRTKQQDEEKIEEMHNRIKAIGRANAESSKRYEKCIETLRRCRHAITREAWQDGPTENQALWEIDELLREKDQDEEMTKLQRNA